MLVPQSCKYSRVREISESPPIQVSPRDVTGHYARTSLYNGEDHVGADLLKIGTYLSTVLFLPEAFLRTCAAR